MDSKIRSAVDQHPLLKMKVNKGERHRIMHQRIESGSLWIAPRSRDYFVLVSGEVEDALYNFLRTRFGREDGEDQGHKYWHISNMADVSEIITQFGNY